MVKLGCSRAEISKNLIELKSQKKKKKKKKKKTKKKNPAEMIFSILVLSGVQSNWFVLESGK